MLFKFRPYSLISCILASALAFSPTVFAQDTEATFKTTEVAEGIYMLSGATGFTGGNVGVSIGEDGVAVIDNGVSSVLDKLRARIAELTDQPVDYLINTHVHGDHTGNNAAFGADGTRIISHDNLRATLVAKGVRGADGNVAAPETALPVITFSDQMTLVINGDKARIIHLQKAHTDGDAIIFFEKANVIHAGDILFNGRFPYIDNANGGSLNGMIEGLQKIAEIGNEQTKIIAGHGPLANKSDLQKIIAMLKDSKKLVGELVVSGKTDEEILAVNPLDKYSTYSWGFISTEKMTGQVIAAVRDK